MSLIVYADFSCPDCYLTSRRADALTAAGVPIDWRRRTHPAAAGRGHAAVRRRPASPDRTLRGS